MMRKMSNNYWAKRQERIQATIADKSIEDIQEQLKKYYAKTMKRVIADFEKTYDKVQLAVEDGREITPAWLYQLDQYWQMQAQLRKELQDLGDKEITLLSENFESTWKDIYEATAVSSDKAFSTISTANAKQMINSSWCADGKTFSQRVWGNTEKLTETLNDELIQCVVAGKKTTELKQALMERFNVSYNQAKTLVNTEITNIQTQAAVQRYKDYGLTKYEFLGRDEHDIGCKCKELNGKVFLLSEMKAGENAPPMHPNCRCCISPVVDNESEENNVDDKLKRANEYRLREFKNNGMTSTNLNIIKSAWAEKRTPDKSELVTYNRRCAICGGTVKSIFQRGRVYHDICIETKKFDEQKEVIECADCGIKFIRYKKYKNQVRCPECQAEYRKKYKAQKEKERREKKKNR